MTQVVSSYGQIYPNPASNEVTVLVKRNSPSARLQVVDMYGRTIFVRNLNEEENRISINLESLQLKGGLYMVTVHENNRVLMKQLVIQK